MPDFSALPPELVLLVAGHLPFVTLSSLASTSSHLTALLHKTVRKQRDALLDAYRSVDAARQTPYPYHRVLLLILRQQLPSSMIRELYCLATPLDPDPREPLTHASTVLGLRPDDRALFHHAIASSPYILEDDGSPDELTDKLWRGDEDTALALLLTHLGNLDALDAPLAGDTTHQVIARLLQDGVIATSSLGVTRNICRDNKPPVEHFSTKTPAPPAAATQTDGKGFAQSQQAQLQRSSPRRCHARQMSELRPQSDGRDPGLVLWAFQQLTRLCSWRQALTG